MWEYKNGNYVVRILDDGTKIRLSENPIPDIPESIDVKITNKCNAGCAFCHEKSHIDGKSFNVNLAYRLFKELPRGIELAIGGGNPLEEEQNLRYLFRKLSNPIYNLTINSIHLEDYKKSYLQYYINAVGVSYRKEKHEEIKKFCEELKKEKKQSVIHIIAGVHSIDDFKRCLKDFDRILILGYKVFGRGIDYYSDEVKQKILEWEKEIGSLLYRDKIIVFDNLAIKQLDIERFFEKEKWSEKYMGNDGEFTMYLDLVEEKFSISSRSEKRYNIGDLTIKEMFNKLK